MRVNSVSVISTLQQLTLQGAAIEQGHALTVGGDRKMAQHAASCQEVGVTFVPVVFETYGVKNTFTYWSFAWPAAWYPTLEDNAPSVPKMCHLPVEREGMLPFGSIDVQPLSLKLTVLCRFYNHF